MVKNAKTTNQDTAIVYVTRDIERALGMAPSESYKIVTNRTPYSETIKAQYPNPGFVTLIDPENPHDHHSLLDTHQLLEKAGSEIKKGANILVFKNTTLIESICKKNGWHLLNPSAELAEKIENKITQIEWLGELGTKYLPPHTVAPTKDLKWKKESLVIQWAHGHTGDGTILINSAAELRDLQTKFPDRMSRASSFVNGPSFTLNIIVTPSGIYTGNISYQITGLPPFTDNPFSTIGNDWSLTHTILSDAEVSQIENMAREIGEKMAKEGWCGMCGIDVMRDNERNQIYLIEINARQPASTTFESYLQQENRERGVAGLTLFEAYFMALLGRKIDAPIIHINDGAQIIKRIAKITKDSGSSAVIDVDIIDEGVVNALQASGYKVIKYSNTDYNSDQLRIQGLKGLMEGHGKFNKRGKEIADLL